MNINKRLSIIALLPAILLTGVQHSTAGEISDIDDIFKKASNNISEEYVTCAAYFSISSEAVRRSGDLRTAGSYDKAFNDALEGAFDIAKEGRTEEMAKKVTLARLDLNMKSMLKEIGNDISNISILLNKHAERCKEIMENPDKMMIEWVDKIRKKRVTK